MVYVFFVHMIVAVQHRMVCSNNIIVIIMIIIIIIFASFFIPSSVFSLQWYCVKMESTKK